MPACNMENTFEFRAADKPPRPAENSLLQIEMSQYAAARGDFGLEFDNFAELDIKEVDFEELESSDDEDEEPMDDDDDKDGIIEGGAVAEKEAVKEVMKGKAFQQRISYFMNRM